MALTEKQIAAYEAKGFRRWTKGDMDRLYINAESYGVTFEYARGRVWGATFGEYDAVPHEARLIKSAKVYVDVATGELHVETESIYADYIRETVEAIIAEIAEQTCEVELTSERGTLTVDLAEYGVTDASPIDGRDLTAFGITDATGMDDENAKRFGARIDEEWPLYLLADGQAMHVRAI